jgi:hypothetical protein
VLTVAATISNENTRAAYYRATWYFFAWLEQHGIDELMAIEPEVDRPAGPIDGTRAEKSSGSLAFWIGRRVGYLKCDPK